MYRRIFIMRNNLIVGLLIFSLSFGFLSCDGGGTGGNTIFEGVISNIAQLGQVTVTIFDGNSNTRLGRTTTSPEGNFGIRFAPRAATIRVVFETNSFTAERPNVPIVAQSVTNWDMTLQQNPILIVINRWQVFQDPISLFNNDSIDYNESQAEFNLDANGGNCMFATGTTLISYRVKSISITDCREGVRAQSSATIILEADEDIEISANRDAVLALDDSVIEVGQSSNPNNNTIIIQSFNQFGINASGNSTVIIDPQNQCSISGDRGAVNVNQSATVDTSTCTLSNS